jgi:hypothetical protein
VSFLFWIYEPLIVVREPPRKQRYRITQSLITVGMTVVSVATCFGWNWSIHVIVKSSSVAVRSIPVRNTTGCLSCKLYCNKGSGQVQSAPSSN